MSKKFLAAVLAALCIASLVAASGASAAEDHQPPELLSLSISPGEVNAATGHAEVTVTAHITDNLSGLSYADVIFISPSHEPQTFGVGLERLEGTAQNGYYRGTSTFSPYAEAGEWRVNGFNMEDVAGNQISLGGGQLRERGLPYTIQVRNEEEPKEEEPPFESSPPQLSELSLEPSEINVTETEAVVRVDAHIKSEAGLKEGYVRFRSPDGVIEQTETFERLSGNEFDGQYVAKAVFPRGAEEGEWRAEVRLGDHAGREVQIGPEDLNERGLPSVVYVFDEAPLRLAGLTIEPTEIDTANSEQSVVVRAHVISEDGPVGGQVVFAEPDPEREYNLVSPDFRLVEGSPEDGVYEMVVSFPRDSTPGRWQGSIDLFDFRGHEVLIGPEALAGRGFPHQVEVVNAASPPVVTGISPSSGPEAGGTAVHIVGSGFDGVTAVHFGGEMAEFVYESPGSITAYAPSGSGNVGVAVTTPAGTSGEVNYHYEAPSMPVTLSSSPDPSVRGQKVTFTATVSPSGEGAPKPLGTVAFVEGSSTLGVVNLSKGVAKLSTTTLGAGEHSVVAEYSGDSHYGAATSPAVSQVVAKATTELTMTSSLNPAPFGSSATLKAHVAAVAPGGGTPAGTVTFREGETVLDTVQLSGGNASLPLKTPAPGVHPISATYSGDANDKASEAGTVKQLITKASTELTLTSTLNPAPFGSSGTLKATVKALAPGGGTPAGTVTFREGETVLATVPLSAGSAKLALKTMAPGEHEIVATYSGEADYEGSADTSGQTIVAASTETNLTSSKNPAPLGAAGTLKATVKALAPGGGTPAGTVTFREGETVLAVIPLSAGSATYPLKALSSGSHEITATYAGDADYTASEAVIDQVITS